MTQNFQLAYSKELNFKMIKNGVYVVVIALLVAKLFKILIYANYRPCDIVRWTQNDVKSQKMKDLKFCSVVTVITKFHDMSTVAFPWQHNGLQALSIQRVKSEFPPFKKCYLLLIFIHWM